MFLLAYKANSKFDLYIYIYIYMIRKNTLPAILKGILLHVNPFEVHLSASVISVTFTLCKNLQVYM